MKREGRAAACRLARLVDHLEHRLAIGGFPGRQCIGGIGAAYHHLDKRVTLEARDRKTRPRISSVAQHRNRIADLEHLLELVRNVDDRRALRPEPADGVEERRGFLERDRGGRLVEKQDLRIGRKRSRDLDELLLRTAEDDDVLRRRDAKSYHFHEGQRFGMNAAAVDRPRAVPHHALEKHVLANREGRDQIALLVDHADPALHRLTRRADVGRLAEDSEGTGIGHFDTADHLDQRRLAGPVLAKQREHLAALERQRDGVERLYPGIGLGDVGKFERRSCAVPRGHCLRRSRRSAAAELISRTRSMPPAARMITPEIS